METSDSFNIKLSQPMASGRQEIQARVHLTRDNLVTKEEICITCKITLIIKNAPFIYQFQMMMVDQITRRSGGLTGLSALSSKKLLKKEKKWFSSFLCMGGRFIALLQD